MNHAADEYDEATPGLGDEFLATVATAFNAIVQAPQRWPRLDARHQRYVLRRFPSASSTASTTPRSSSSPSLIISASPATGRAAADRRRPRPFPFSRLSQVKSGPGDEGGAPQGS